MTLTPESSESKVKKALKIISERKLLLLFFFLRCLSQIPTETKSLFLVKSDEQGQVWQKWSASPRDRTADTVSSGLSVSWAYIYDFFASDPLQRKVGENHSENGWKSRLFARSPLTMLRCRTMCCDYVPVFYDFSCRVLRPHATTSGGVGVVCVTTAQ